MKGASRSTISDLYPKKYKSELPDTTFFRWTQFDVASCLLEKEEELIEHFLELQIDENKAAAPVHDQEIVEIQDPEVLNKEKSSSAKDPKKKQLKITSFFK